MKDKKCPECGSIRIIEENTAMFFLGSSREESNLRNHILFKCLNCGHKFKQKSKEEKVIENSLLDYAKLRCLEYLDYNCYTCGGYDLELRDGDRVVCINCGRDWYETRKNKRIEQVFNCLRRGKTREDHVHYLGSELCCEICNPHCHKKHLEMRRKGENFLKWCGHPKCPARHIL